MSGKFDLQQAIKEWRKELEKQSGLEPGYIEEIEGHLRDTIDALRNKGLTAEEAFHKASERVLRKEEDLENEFYQSRKRPVGSDSIPSATLLPNYIKVAFRQLYRQKGYSIINIVGLAIGIACCILILLYIKHELSYDTFHTHYDRIYRLTNMNPTSGRPGIAKVTGPWGIAAKENIPEVKEVVRFVPFTTPLVKRGGISNYEIGGVYADTSVFEVFSYKPISGNLEAALEQPGSIVLTKSFAEIYFGNENPLGQTLLFNGSEEYQVTGIIEDVPRNTHLPFRFVASMSSLNHPDKDHWIRWNQFYTYLLLEENASPEAVAQKFTDLLPRFIGEEAAENYTAELQPITDIHLKSKLWREFRPTSDITYIYLFGAVAFFILLIGCVNYTNLATARALNRTKEVGIRKSIGARRSALVVQFLGESLMYASFASLLAVGMAILIIDEFSQISGQTFYASDLWDVNLILGLLGLILIIGILSGSYPAFLLSKFKPVQTLKGDAKVSNNYIVRGGLVIFQFAIAAGLILATGVIKKQLEFVQNANLGFDKDQLVILRIRDNTLREKSETFKQELLRNPNITHASITANFPGGTDYGIPTQPEGVPEEDRPGIRILAVDHDFIETFGMELAEGRDFSKEISIATFGAVIINQEAARQLGWEDPLGKRIAMEGVNFGPAPVIGVLKDFHFRTLREAINPIMLFIPSPEWYSYYILKIRGDNIDETLTYIKEKWKAFDPVNPFSYVFFDNYYQSLYQQEQNTEQMLSYFTILAIVLSALGLFGLASFIAEKRTKEVGIRKVLGASVSEIVLLMGKQFTKLVAIALLFAIPLAYLAMHSWLTNFAYKTSISWSIVLMTIAGAFLIAWISVSYQSVKAALVNPVNSLRSE